MWMREWSQTAMKMWKNQNELGCTDIYFYIYLYFYIYIYIFSSLQSSQMYTPKLMKNLCLPSWQEYGMIRVLIGARTNTFGVRDRGRILNLVRVSTFRSRNCLYAYPCISQTYGWETRCVSFPKHMVSFSVFPFCLMCRMWCAVSCVFQPALHFTRSLSTRTLFFFFNNIFSWPPEKGQCQALAKARGGVLTTKCKDKLAN